MNAEEKLALATALHASSMIIEVPLELLRVDKTYQRVPTQSLVEKIMAEHDPLARDTILVSDRGPRTGDEEIKGGLYIINGQHRYLAVLRLGHKTIEARVIDLTGYDNPVEIEAGLRLKTNVGLRDRPAERFRAQLIAGDPESLGIVKIMDSYDTEFNEATNKVAGLNAISAVEGLYRWDEGPLLDATFGVMKDAYGIVGGETATVGVMKGIGWFLECHAEDMLRDRLVTKIQEIGHSALDRRARASASVQGGTLWLNYYRVLVELYNERLSEKTRLTWQLKGVTRFGGRNTARTVYDNN